MNLYDLEKLSAYLDGQLPLAESSKIEKRLQTELELVSALQDLRSARNILRQLPARKAPKNFTLTRQMVGQKPPLPRSYPIFRLATVFASILFIFSIATTALRSAPSLMAAEASAPLMYGYGMGGGCEEPCGEPAAQAAPLEEAAPALSATLMPDSAAAEDGARLTEPQASPVYKEGDPMGAAETFSEEMAEVQNQPETESEASFFPSYFWPVFFFILSLSGSIIIWIMKRLAKSKWQ